MVVSGPLAEPQEPVRSALLALVPCRLLAWVPVEQAAPALVAAEPLGQVLVAVQELVRVEA